MLHATTLLLIIGFMSSALAPVSAESSIRMVRSLSGPSGKVIGSKFELDEIRNRFVYPQDNSLTVYFECQAPKGNYTLTAYWKDPQGRTVGISPDLKIQTVNEELNSYWVFMIDPGKVSGVWTVEIRVNGEPVGAHSFELAMPAVTQQAAVEAPTIPSLGELYRSGVKSLVWVHKLDNAGLRLDTTSGFVVGPASVLTAFQSIDMAAALEIEFADGSLVRTNEILACSRLQDWALVKTAPHGAPPLAIGKSESAIVGEQAVVFSVGAGASRIIGAVDIAGRGVIRGFGERIQINPQLPSMDVGGPLLDNYGKVVGVIGGSLAPGMHANHRQIPVALEFISQRGIQISVTPVDGIDLQPKSPAVTLQNLFDSGVLTTPLSKTPVFRSGAITDKVEPDFSYTTKTQFPRKNSEIIVYTIWEGKEKIKKGAVSVNIYDAGNRIRSRVQPKTINLPLGKLIRYQCNFNSNNIEAGLYRIDLLWNGEPIWRAHIAVTE